MTAHLSPNALLSDEPSTRLVSPASQIADLGFLLHADYVVMCPRLLLGGTCWFVALILRRALGLSQFQGALIFLSLGSMKRPVEKRPSLGQTICSIL